MNAWVLALALLALTSTAMAGGYGGGHGAIILAGHGGGYGGGYGGGLGGYSKVVPGPSFLVNTVHRVHKISQGAALVGTAQHGGGYGGGFGGGFGGGYGGGFGGGHGGYGSHGW
ncbi:uncharacterized protein LOC144097510 [Amblyomma americanum]